MANWTVAQKKAAARIFAQALPSITTDKSSIKPSLTVINNQYWKPILSSSSTPNSSITPDLSDDEYDLKTSESDDEFSEESGTTTDEVLFVFQFAVCVLLMSCMVLEF